MKHPNQNKLRNRLPFIILVVTLLLAAFISARVSLANSGQVERRVNISYLGSGSEFEPAIFWFGQVTPTINNADVRLWYYDEYMKVVVHIIDRRLWYDDQSPSPATLEEWDAVSLFLNLDGNTGNSPTPASYRLVSQLNWWEAVENYQAAYRGEGSGWVEVPLSFTSEPTWRGNAPNDDYDDKGWQATFVIPFSSLGLSGPPVKGTKWGLAVAVHDRDDADGSPMIADQVWPELAEANVPATWGEMNFGIPAYNRLPGLQQGVTTVRQGLNGAQVVDGHVGGHTVCGAGLDHWTEWGEKNWGGWNQINIQNQWDISDYPCFSKYYVTFPLDAVPPGKTILDASLSMTLFGNAGGGEWGVPEDSFIQVLTVAEDWDEETLNWNNAPLAVENISGTWVKPVQTSEQRIYEWDVSRAVAGAYQAGQPLRLALYSIDGELHSGKYFWSSDSNDWDLTQRPTLNVIWGDACDSADVECHFYYLPAISQ